MMKDPTLERIWHARDAIAKRAGYQSKTLVRNLIKEESVYKRTENEALASIARESSDLYGETKE